MNSELLQSVAQDILDEKLKLEMNYWCVEPVDMDLSHEQAACGTVACIAGWIVIKAGLAELQQYPGHWRYRVDRNLTRQAHALDRDPWPHAALKALDVEWDSDLGRELYELFRVQNEEAKLILPYLAQGHDVTTAMDLGHEDWCDSLNSVA